MICIGHHPLQNPHYIKPDIGQLSKSVVDRIPLVLYIPSPPEGDPFPKGHITKPDPAHTYPPKPPVPASPRRTFAFLRIKHPRRGTARNVKDKDGSGTAEKSSGSGESWEDNWEQGECPFARLEGNHATCAICLMDFEEPSAKSSRLSIAEVLISSYKLFKASKRFIPFSKSKRMLKRHSGFC